MIAEEALVLENAAEEQNGDVTGKLYVEFD